MRLAERISQLALNIEILPYRDCADLFELFSTVRGRKRITEAPTAQNLRTEPCTQSPDCSLLPLSFNRAETVSARASRAMVRRHSNYREKGVVVGGSEVVLTQLDMTAVKYRTSKMLCKIWEE